MLFFYDTVCLGTAKKQNSFLLTNKERAILSGSEGDYSTDIDRYLLSQRFVLCSIACI